MLRNCCQKECSERRIRGCPNFLNTKFSAEWPNITQSKEPPADADEHKGEEGKFEKFFSPEPGEGD